MRMQRLVAWEQGRNRVHSAAQSHVPHLSSICAWLILTYTCMYVAIHVYFHIYIHTYIHTYICIYILTSIHAYIHTYITIDSTRALVVLIRSQHLQKLAKLEEGRSLFVPAGCELLSLCHRTMPVSLQASHSCHSCAGWISLRPRNQSYGTYPPVC